MLTITSGGGSRDCEGTTRRDFLRVGALSLGGLSLPSLLAARAGAAQGDKIFVRDKAVVLLYLSGGASHIETFDPHMNAPDGIRSVTGEVATKISGVTFGGTFERLAALADKMAVVRSHSHNVGNHEQAHVHVLSGGTDPVGTKTRGHSIGSLFARVRGANHPLSGLPTYALLTEKEIDNQYERERGRILDGSWPGTIGPSYAAFGHEVGWEQVSKTGGESKSRRGDDRKKSAAKSPLAASMVLNQPAELLDDRMSLLAKIDSLRRQSDARGHIEAVDKFQSQAVNLVLGGAADAFDFRKEDAKLIERYDTSRIPIGFKVFRPSTLGKQMLVARRLCEAGVGFVTVHSAGWDMHADGNNPSITKGMDMLGRSLDLAVSAFIEDIYARGLDEKILLVITGDFGRSPKVNAKGGRDHYPRLCTLAFAGGGLPMGQVIGQSTKGADMPASDPISPAHILGTMMHTVFDIGQLRLDSSVPQDLSRLIQNSQPIRELVR